MTTFVDLPSDEITIECSNDFVIIDRVSAVNIEERNPFC